MQQSGGGFGSFSNTNTYKDPNMNSSSGFARTSFARSVNGNPTTTASSTTRRSSVSAFQNNSSSTCSPSGLGGPRNFGSAQDVNQSAAGGSGNLRRTMSARVPSNSSGQQQQQQFSFGIPKPQCEGRNSGGSKNGFLSSASSRSSTSNTGGGGFGGFGSSCFSIGSTPGNSPKLDQSAPPPGDHQVSLLAHRASNPDMGDLMSLSFNAPKSPQQNHSHPSSNQQQQQQQQLFGSVREECLLGGSFNQQAGGIGMNSSFNNSSSNNNNQGLGIGALGGSFGFDQSYKQNAAPATPHDDNIVTMTTTHSNLGMITGDSAGGGPTCSFGGETVTTTGTRSNNLTPVTSQQQQQDTFGGSFLGSPALPIVTYTNGNNKKRVDQPEVNDSHFDRQRILGHGSSATVYEAIHKPSNTVLALKEISKEYIKARANQGYSVALREEINLHRRLKHPNVVRLFTYFSTRDSVVLVMEPCIGGDLYDFLKKGQAKHREESEAQQQVQQQLFAGTSGFNGFHPRSGSTSLASSANNSPASCPLTPMSGISSSASSFGTLPPPPLSLPQTTTMAKKDEAKFPSGLLVKEVRRILRQVAKALKHLHEVEGVVHRDLKLENILLHQDGQVRLADFGWARSIHPLDLPCTPASTMSLKTTASWVGGPASGTNNNAPDQSTVIQQERRDEQRFTICGTLDYMAPEIIREVIAQHERSTTGYSSRGGSPIQAQQQQIRQSIRRTSSSLEGGGDTLFGFSSIYESANHALQPNDENTTNRQQQHGDDEEEDAVPCTTTGLSPHPQGEGDSPVPMHQPQMVVVSNNSGGNGGSRLSNIRPPSLDNIESPQSLLKHGQVRRSPSKSHPPPRYTPASDIWSFGCIVHELITGTPPFYRDDRRETANAIVQERPLFVLAGSTRNVDPLAENAHLVVADDNAAEVIHACLNKDSMARPTAQQLLDHPFLRRH